jgi:hypothetical protein
MKRTAAKESAAFAAICADAFRGDRHWLAIEILDLEPVRYNVIIIGIQNASLSAE